jgi:hypothetical protein
LGGGLSPMFDDLMSAVEADAPHLAERVEAVVRWARLAEAALVGSSAMTAQALSERLEGSGEQEAVLGRQGRVGGDQVFDGDGVLDVT